MCVHPFAAIYVLSYRSLCLSAKNKNLLFICKSLWGERGVFLFAVCGARVCVSLCVCVCLLLCVWEKVFIHSNWFSHLKTQTHMQIVRRSGSAALCLSRCFSSADINSNQWIFTFRLFLILVSFGSFLCCFMYLWFTVLLKATAVHTYVMWLGLELISIHHFLFPVKSLLV